MGLDPPLSITNTGTNPVTDNFIDSIHSGLQLKHEGYDTGSRCNSVAFNMSPGASGDIQLIVGCSEGLKYLRSDLADQLEDDDDGAWHGDAMVAEHQGQLFLLQDEDDSDSDSCFETQTVMERGTSTWSELWRFSDSSRAYADLSVSAQYVACINKQDNKIMLCDRKCRTNTTVSHSLPSLDVLHNLHFLPDGTLLATGETSKHEWVLSNYTVKGNGEKIQITKNWSCGLLAESSGIASAANGLIFVCRKKLICIVNAEGLLYNITNSGIFQLVKNQMSTQ